MIYWRTTRHESFHVNRIIHERKDQKKFLEDEKNGKENPFVANGNMQMWSPPFFSCHVPDPGIQKGFRQNNRSRRSTAPTSGDHNLGWFHPPTRGLELGLEPGYCGLCNV